MRLLNTATLEFEELFRDRVPEYAILSHRWEFGEVPFKELHSPTACKKKGYAKICDFCDEVRSQGYDYAWVDTCCINKKDFTELAEAVNSMFSWYKNSSTCLTYLSDFLLRPELGQQQFESDLAKSQWFRRG
jgi:Fe-S-cluster-containing dehydrogenase component